MAFTLKQFCLENGIDSDKVFDMVLNNGGGILPTPVPFTGYFAHIQDDSIVCYNDKLKIKQEIPFSSFTRAEFGIGNGNLWLQCIVDGADFIFCTTRKSWKSPAGKLLLDKISKHTEIIAMKQYEGYTGKWFIFYLFK